MDLGTMIIGAVSLAIFISPFALTNMSRIKQNKQLFQSLSNMATLQNCKITQYEFCGSFIIGLDENANFLFFFKRPRQKDYMEVSKTIKLAEVQNCKIINSNKEVKNNNSESRKIDKLALSFSFFTKNRPEVVLEFYNFDESFQLEGELQLIEKWVKIINDKLKHQKK